MYLKKLTGDYISVGFPPSSLIKKKFGKIAFASLRVTPLLSAVKVWAPQVHWQSYLGGQGFAPLSGVRAYCHVLLWSKSFRCARHLGEFPWLRGKQRGVCVREVMDHGTSPNLLLLRQLVPLRDWSQSESSSVSQGEHSSSPQQQH